MSTRQTIGIRKTYPVRLAAAHDNRDGTGASLMFTASRFLVPSPPPPPLPPTQPFREVVYQWHGGIMIEAIRIQPRAVLAHDVLVRFFMDVPAALPHGIFTAGRFMLHEQKVLATTHPEMRLPFDDTPPPPYDPVDRPMPYGPVDLNRIQMNGPWVFNPGFSLYASCSTADPFDVFAFGGELQPDLSDTV